VIALRISTVSVLFIDDVLGARVEPALLLPYLFLSPVAIERIDLMKGITLLLVGVMVKIETMLLVI